MYLLLYYTQWCFIVGVYVKFDGLMHPQLNHDKLKQLQSKEGSKHSLWSSVTGILSKFKNYVIPSSEGETKFSPPLALRIYLSKYHKILTGKICTSKSPPTEVITDIIDIFNSLYKAYLQIDNISRLLPNKSDIQKVCIHFIGLFKYLHSY